MRHKRVAINAFLRQLLRQFFHLDWVDWFLQFNREKELISDRLLPLIGTAFIVASIGLAFAIKPAHEVVQKYPDNWLGYIGVATIYLFFLLFLGVGYLAWMTWYKAPPHGES